MFVGLAARPSPVPMLQLEALPVIVFANSWVLPMCYIQLACGERTRHDMRGVAGVFLHNFCR